MKLRYTLLAFALTLYFATKAQLPGYSFVQAINVSNTSTVNAVNYQLRLTVNTQTLISASQMIATGDDIRFGKTCNGSALYNYWIEAGINTPTTTIWVKIDSISAGGSRTIFMFYGNPAATPVTSIPLVFPSGGSSTDSVSSGSPGGSANSQRGFRFSPNVDILVTSLGKNEPTGTMRYVTLFDNASTSIITQQQVAGPSGVYTYSPLPSPIWLGQGTQYVLQLYQGAGDGYYFGTSTQIDSRLTYYDMRYCNGCTQNTFPTNVLSGYHYGYPDLLFYYRNMITPAPTYTLMGGAQPVISVNSGSVCAGSSFTMVPSGASTYTYSGGSAVVTPTASASYSVTGTNTLGCISFSPAISNVTVNPSPTVTAVMSPSMLCTGQTATLTAGGASTYTWNTTATTTAIAVSPTVTTSYTVTGTLSGCMNMAVSTVTVNPTPTVTAVSSASLLCAGQTATLTAGGANTYTWSTSATTTVVAVSPTVTISYTVNGTAANGCTNMAILTQSVSSCTGIDELSAGQPGSFVYPNPNKGIFDMELNSSAQVIITNPLGSVILSETMNAGKQSFNIQNKANGIYFIRIIKQDRQQVIKVIKE